MNLQPVSKGSRIDVVDGIRGFALFGVLIANIPVAPPETISGNWDSILNFLTHFLIDKKFIAIFSILFGFGFYNQMSRAEESNTDFKKYFVIRMVLLYIIGCIHSYGIWNGDIIMTYALGGLLLLPVRKWTLKKLLLLAILFNVLLTGFFFIANSAFGWQVYNYDYALDKEYPVTPSFTRYLVINFIMNPWTNFFKDMPITIVFTFGNMLVGFILGKVAFFHFQAKARKLSLYFIVFGSTIGLIASYIYHKVTVGELVLDISLLWLPFVIAAGVILHSLFYISLFLILYKYTKARMILSLFSIVGRMALSNYILQSIFYLLLIYHCTHIFQLFGRVTIGQTYLIATGLFVFQTILSYFWQKRHSQGPLEYVWKKISYKSADTIIK